MKNISVNNGASYCTAEEAINQVGWEAIVEVMDDETREHVAGEFAPCTEVEFLTGYLELAEHDLVIG